MATKNFSKKDEIDALKALCKMDGYFADTFGADIDKMIENNQWRGRYRLSGYRDRIIVIFTGKSVFRRKLMLIKIDAG